MTSEKTTEISSNVSMGKKFAPTRSYGLNKYTRCGIYHATKLTFICSKSAEETLEKGVKYVQSLQ